MADKTLHQLEREMQAAQIAYSNNLEQQEALKAAEPGLKAAWEAADTAYREAYNASQSG